MANITLAIPEDLHKVVKKHREVRWSEIARRAITEYAKKIEIIEEITGKEVFDGVIKKSYITSKNKPMKKLLKSMFGSLKGKVSLKDLRNHHDRF